MNKISGVPITTDKLVYRLRLMADSGGMLTRDRTRTIIEAADRLEDLDERVASMSEPADLEPLGVDPFQEDWR